MRPTVTRLVTDVVILTATAILLFYLSKVFTGYADYFRLAFAGLILSGGVLISRALSRIIAVEFKSELGKNAPVISNTVAVLGYVVAAAAAASYLSFSPAALLAEAAFSGLVLGLALQPTLGSFFAGILILLSGAIRPGSHVRILTWHIPFQWANAPGYKYFSPDSVYAGYMGEVKEVGLFFTKILTEEGQMMKIPNSILATDAAVVSYTEEDYFFNVRYEFPNRFDPEMVLLQGQGGSSEVSDCQPLRQRAERQGVLHRQGGAEREGEGPRAPKVRDTDPPRKAAQGTGGGGESQGRRAGESVRADLVEAP